MVLGAVILSSSILAASAAWSQSYTAPAEVPAELAPGGAAVSVSPRQDPDLVTGSIPLDSTGQASSIAGRHGDNLAGVIIPETEMVKSLRAISSSSLIYNRNTGEVSNEIGIHKTNAITWNSFLENV